MEAIMGLFKSRKFWTRLAGVLVVGGLVVLTVISIRAFNRPLGPALDAIGLTASPVTDLAAPNLVATSTVKPVTEPATPIPAASPTANLPTNTAVSPAVDVSEVCGETGAWNVLILGSDASELRGPKGSDLTRAARIDFSNKKVVIYAFTRDLWVTTTSVGFTNPAINMDRLGQIFYEGRNRSTQTDNRNKMVDGTRANSKAMTENFSLQFDHYVTVDLSQLPAMIDKIGGLPMYVPERTTDPWIGMVIEAGQQTLSGNQVQAYARAIPDSDFGRIQRNNLLLEALRQKLLDPIVWIMVPQLFQQFSDAIVTDLSPAQITNLACLLKTISKESIIEDEVKPEWTTPGPQQSLLWDKAKVLARLKELELIQ
jgi:LCP family protein required for cell wall assembly